MSKKRVLILTTPVGGGHLATARAVYDAFSLVYPGQLDIKVVDVLKQVKVVPPVDRMAVPFYSSSVRMLNSYPYKLFFKFSEASASLLNRFATTVFKEAGERFLREQDPDVVISTFPIISYAASTIIKRGWHKELPLISIITDAGDVHKLWLLGNDDVILVSTPDTIDYAVEHGVPRERVKYLGFPLDNRFRDLPTQKTARRNLKLPDMMTVLVSAGGLGLSPNKMISLARQLSKLQLGVQYVFVAGKNPQLQQELENIPFRDPMRVYGFVDTMPELLMACDLVIGKAGWISLYEAMVARRPTFIMHVIPGQEEPNAEYVLKHGVGQVLTNTKELVAEVVRHAENPELLDEYQQNFKKLKLHAFAGEKIARYIGETFLNIPAEVKPGSRSSKT